MFIDVCLKFVDEEQANEVLLNSGVYKYLEDSDKFLTSDEYAVDKIGMLTKATGEVNSIEDEDGRTFEIPVTVDLDGYHVNLRCAALVPEGLDEYIVVPKNPRRVWA